MISNLNAVPLIGLAHGSRHPGVAAGLESLMRAVECDTDFSARAAFLDLTDPDLASAAKRLAAEGHDTAVVVPLLFTEAFHARIDAPAAIARAAHDSGLRLMTAEVIGTGDDVVEVLVETAHDHGIAAGDSIVLYAVGSSEPSANEAVQDLADRWQRRRGASVSAAFGTRVPRGRDVVAAAAGPTVVVPLFVSPGLLLQSIEAAAAEAGIRVLPPLGTRLTSIITARYGDALGSC